MRIDGLKIIISFLLGVGFCWVFIDKYNGDILLLFQTAYETGKQDGYSLGHSDRLITDFPYYQKESMCMFLYAEDYKR